MSHSYTHSYLFLVPRFSFDNLKRFSSRCRFDFDNVKHIITYSIFLSDDAVAVFQKTVMKLSAAVKMKQYSVALHLLKELLQRYAPVNHNTLSIAIDCYCQLKRAGFGFAISGALFKRGYEIAVGTFTTPTKGLLSVGRIDDAAKLVKKKLMDEKLGEPNEVTFYIDNLGALQTE